MAFADKGDIWEHDLASARNTNLTSTLIDKGLLKHPEYSTGGKTANFISSFNGTEVIKAVPSDLSVPEQIINSGL